MPNLLRPIGGIQARVQTMGLGKLCLIGLDVVEAEQSHPQVMVCMGKCRTEAHGFAATGGSILKFPCVEQRSAEGRRPFAVINPRIRRAIAILDLFDDMPCGGLGFCRGQRVTGLPTNCTAITSR